MTENEAIQFLDNIKHEEAGRAIGKDGFYAELMGYHVEALNMAIKALETIPKYKDAYNKGWDDGAKASYEHLKMCEEEQGGDLISRQAVLDMMQMRISGKELYKAVYELSPVNPQKPSSSENPNKWIPVSERLPEHYQNILFSTKTDRVFEGRYFKDETEHQWYSFRDECFAWNNVVTAWMPLPKPYEPQESEDKG